MNHGLLYRFFVRWLVCGLGLWVAAGLLGSGVDFTSDNLGVVVLAGLFLAIINSIIRPVIVILSLPAILFSLGLFMILINGLMVYLASRLYAPLEVTNFWMAVLAGMIIGLVNYLVTTVLESREQ